MTFQACIDSVDTGARFEAASPLAALVAAVKVHGGMILPGAFRADDVTTAFTADGHRLTVRECL